MLVSGDVVIVAALTSPVTWPHTYASAIVPFALLWRERLRQPGARRAPVLLFVACVAVGTIFIARLTLHAAS